MDAEDNPNVAAAVAAGKDSKDATKDVKKDPKDSKDAKKAWRKPCKGTEQNPSQPCSAAPAPTHFPGRGGCGVVVDAGKKYTGIAPIATGIL